MHEVNSGVGNSNSKRLHPQHTWVDQGLDPNMVDEACLVKAKFDNVISLTRPPPILHILILSTSAFLPKYKESYQLHLPHCHNSPLYSGPSSIACAEVVDLL
jgi:hypothetical protein